MRRKKSGKSENMWEWSRIQKINFLSKDEFEWFSEALKEFWWRRKPGVWAKHLVKRNYELWFSFGRNRKGEFLALTVHSGRQVKRTFFPAGDQRKGWWKLLVAVFELADRSVRSSKKSIKNEQAILLSKASTEKNQEKPVKASFRYPHCEVLIHFTMKVGDVRSCAASAGKRKEMEVGRAGKIHC